MLASHLPARFPEIYRREGDSLLIAPLGETWDLRRTDFHPLDLAARLVQEAERDGYVLAALSVCFPSRWRIAEKLGKPLRDIHAPVPHYDEKLARIAGHPDDCRRLAATIRALPEATFRYKSLPVFAEAALAWLGRHAGAAAPLRTAS